MPSADCAHLYAELLANIRQISLAAALPSPCDSSTRVAISADCQTVELKHRGSTCALKLPGKASLGGVVLPIQDKQHGSTSLEWRLPLDASSLPPANQADNTPWSATDLDAESGVDCRGCANNIVRSGSVKVWKDLPSGNWAEMMEFWHCHKPDHHHHHHDGKTGKAGNQSLAMRGYGASSSISARKGVGFVDLTTLLLDETDCQPLTFSLSTHDQGTTDRQGLSLTGPSANQIRSLNIFCTSCNAQLGFFNFRTSAVTLLKWQVSCKSASGTAPSIPECLAATLIATIARSGSSKSLITPLDGSASGADGKTDPNSALHLWVLNSNIVYSSSEASQRVPAIKLLYRNLSVGEADKMLEAVTCDSQEISIPAQAIGDVVRHLEHSSRLLPPKERKFKEWNVGLLTRWEQKAW